MNTQGVTQPSDSQDEMTLSEYAKRAGVPLPVLYRMIKEGMPKDEKFGVTVVNAAKVAAWFNEFVEVAPSYRFVPGGKQSA